MTDKKKNTSFEEALKELEEIAEKLERGQLTLEDSIKSYERGMELKNICMEKLGEAEGKIEILAKNSSEQSKKTVAAKKPKSEDQADEAEENLF